jgi:hypothetical protein
MGAFSAPIWRIQSARRGRADVEEGTAMTLNLSRARRADSVDQLLLELQIQLLLLLLPGFIFLFLDPYP